MNQTEYQRSRVVRQGIQKTLAREFGAPFAVAAWIRQIDAVESETGRMAWPSRLTAEQDQWFVEACRWGFMLWAADGLLDTIEAFEADFED